MSSCTPTGSISTLLDCIKTVCDASKSLTARLVEAAQSIATLRDTMDANGQAIKCVVNGPVDSVCVMPEGAVLPTLAEAIDNLNACQITDISGDSFTAVNGQTDFTLGAAVANPYLLEVALDGAICRYPADYTISGTTLAFTHGLTTGDTVDTRRFTV